MPVSPDQIRIIFADAVGIYEAALERMDADDLRDAAEKAWCATKRATDALVLARTGEEPERTPVTSRELRRLAGLDQGIDTLVSRYYTRMSILHGECFYLGLCEPAEDIKRRILETSDYIRDAEVLAQVD